MAEDKGHKPTEKKLMEARKKGKTSKSQFFTQVLGFTTFILVLFLFGHSCWLDVRSMLEYCFGSGFSGTGSPPISSLCAQSLEVLLITILKLLLPVCAVCVCGEVLQADLKVEPAVLLPDFSRISPSAGSRRLGSGLKQFPLGICKAVIFGFIVFKLISAVCDKVPFFMIGPLNGAWSIISPGMSVLLRLAVVMVCWGVIDCILARRRFFRELSMSTDELRREHKESEGDPLVKSMRRHLHESMLMHDLVKRVRSSKVVVVESNRSW